MQLPTYTSIWTVEKRLYKIYDWTLPYPVPYSTAGIFLAVGFVWCGLLALLNVPFNSTWYVLWLVPPGGAAVVASRPIAEEKRPQELIASYVRHYLSEPSKIHRLNGRGDADGDIVEVIAQVWVPDPDLWRVPEPGAGVLSFLRRPVVVEEPPVVIDIEAVERQMPSAPPSPVEVSAPRPDSPAPAPAADVLYRPSRDRGVSVLAPSPEPEPEVEVEPEVEPEPQQEPVPQVARADEAEVAPGPVEADAEVVPEPEPDDTERWVPSEAPTVEPAEAAVPAPRPRYRGLRPVAIDPVPDVTEVEEEPEEELAAVAEPHPEPTFRSAPRGLRAVETREHSGEDEDAGSRVSAHPAELGGGADADEVDDEPEPAVPEPAVPTPEPEPEEEPVRTPAPEPEPALEEERHPEPVADLAPAEAGPSDPAVVPPSRSDGPRPRPSSRVPSLRIPLPSMPSMPSVPDGLKVKRRPSSRKAGNRELVSRVAHPVPHHHRIVVASAKGGAGRTVTSLMLGHTLATWRDNPVVVIDGPGSEGVGHRVRGGRDRTITRLVAESGRIAVPADVARYATTTPTRLDVVAGDASTSGHHGDAVALLSDHYELLVADTSAGSVDEQESELIAASDAVVIVVPTTVDGARAAHATLDWLRDHHPDLADGAVAVVNDIGPLRSGKVAEKFAAGCRAVVEVPKDAHLAAGGVVSLGGVQQATRDAYLAVAAAVIDGIVLAQADREPIGA